MFRLKNKAYAVYNDMVVQWSERFSQQNFFAFAFLMYLCVYICPVPSAVMAIFMHTIKLNLTTVFHVLLTCYKYVMLFQSFPFHLISVKMYK